MLLKLLMLYMKSKVLPHKIYNGVNAVNES